MNFIFNENNIHLYQSYESLLSDPKNSSCEVFLKSFLSSRRRYYDAEYSSSSDDDFSINPLDRLDEIVLRLLSEQSSLYSSTLLAEILDGPSLFDLSSLYGMSNPSSVSQALRRLLEPPPCAPLRNKLTSSLQAVADILSKDIPRGIAEAATEGNNCTSQLTDLAAYMCDVLHGTSRLLSLSSLACMHAFPDTATVVPVGSTALFPAKATPSQLPLLGAIVATYECSFPVLIFLLGKKIKGKTFTHLKIALHSSLLAVNSVLESVYFSELRSIRSSGGGESKTFIASSRAKSCAPAMCSFLTILSSHKAYDLFSGLSLPSEAHSSYKRFSSSPCFFFHDLSRIFRLQEIVEPLLNAAAAACILNDIERTQIHKLFTRKQDEMRGLSLQQGLSTGPSAADILAVKEVLPTASEESIILALSNADGDVGRAIERLLIDPSSAELPNHSPSAVSTPFLDSSIRKQTLELALRLEKEDYEKKVGKGTSSSSSVPVRSVVERDDVDYSINVESLVDNLLYEDEMVDDFDEAGFELDDGGMIGNEVRGANVELLGGKGQQALLEEDVEEEEEEEEEEDIDYGLVNYRNEGVVPSSKPLKGQGSSTGVHHFVVVGHGPRAAGGLTKRAANRKTQRGNAHRGGRGGMKRMPAPAPDKG